MRNIFVIGATSAIAQHTARCFAQEGDRFFLIARSQEKMDAVASDLTTRGAKEVFCHAADLAQTKTHEELIALVIERLTKIDIVLMAYGKLPDQKKCEASWEEARGALDDNFVSVVSWLTLLANYFEKQKFGTIAVISSVAGDRGRKSNYLYGSAKGGLTLFLSGLRGRLYASGVHVLTIKPGFVDTPMTAHLKKGFLFAKPEKVGRTIYRAILRKKNVIYAPGYWRQIMLLIRLVPECWFKKL